MGDCCADYIVSSYLTSPDTLKRARADMTSLSLARREMKVLLAGVPTPYRGRPLNGVIQEVERLHAVFKDLAVEILPLEPEDDAFKAVPAGAGASVQCILDHFWNLKNQQ